MASFAEVAAQTESVIPLPSAGESSDDCMRTSATFLHQQAATDAPSQTIFASNGILYGDAIMQTEEGSHYIPAQQPAMTSSASPPTTGGASGALSALAALATSAAMQRDTPMQPHQQLEDDHHHHHQILHSSAPIAIARNTVITPHQTSSDDDSEAMPPPPPRIPTTVPPLQPQPYPTSVDSDGFTSILAFHNDTTTSLFSSSPHYHNQNKRVGGRIRSASNPEGMEKWDSYTRRNDRMHFVLPSSILEEELASTKRILEEKRMEEDYVKGYIKKGDVFSTSPLGAMAEFSPDHHHHVNVHPNVDAVTATTTTTATASRRSRRQHKPKNIFGTSPDSVTSDLTAPPVSTSKSKKKNQSSSTATSSSSSSSSSSKCHINEENLTLNIGDEEEEDIDESLLEPEELLRRARSRLLEDLSEGSEDGVNGGAGGGGLNGEKGVLTLPHSLGKYKEVYNKNGRIGIYTPAERAAIIQKFNAKRARRVWNKKIRYNCRKNLADRRMRVKGRFVKRSVEAANSPPPPEDENDKAAADAVVETISRSKNSSPPTTGSPLTTVNEGEEHDDDEAMPDVADEEAGFNPTEDMPYRRTRRYTIT
uniref:CCT domain-containing protein n=1 Tax=Skeletonema marinoi TaxID=267567 RepID=A0A7S2PPE5_9STRA|mmetsp:Transcript_27601/g.46723  ORF Transcript_27601/g.46723 Transcript_27601/m.46723 type:complete len:593 (+) Transcript_27601:148-1926(+)